MPHDESRVPVGSRISELRQRQKLTQQELAAKAHVSKRSIENAENCKPMRVSTVARIAEALQTDVPSLTEDTLSRTDVEYWKVAVQVNRMDSEGRGDDPLLARAESAEITAMTFQSLYLSLTSGLQDQLQSLAFIDLSVYALPVLHVHHPLYSSEEKHLTLSNEWRSCVEGSLRCLADLPSLRLLTLTIISAEPTLTGAIIKPARSDMTFIRFTFPLSENHPNNTPQLEVPQSSRFFTYFASVFQRIRGRGQPMSFIIAKRLDEQCDWSTFPNFRRPGLGDFVKRLGAICNHPGYEARDQYFSVARTLPVSDEPVCRRPWIRPADFQAECAALDGTIRDSGRRLDCEVDFTDCVVTLSEEGATTGRELQCIAGSHILACFLLMVPPARASGPEEKVGLRDQRNSVVLVARPKPGRTGPEKTWRYDVPGGKCVVGDRGYFEIIERELVEELGIIPARERFDPRVLGVKYDFASQKEGMPVIALYYWYRLDDEEWSYLSDVSGRDTKSLGRVSASDLMCDFAKEEARYRRGLKPLDGTQKTIIACDIAEVIEHSAGGRADEWIHAPREALVELLQRIQTSGGTD